ncbi:MAG: hypothetical protein E6J90_41535 [Deltaproteobacteria bacterium]|nr:MAG: hypothetical protein E6J90_41535 [Deltaproteobacteria bacterium]TMQ11686.1 MAG: hypothetical protein E6J91_22375 [Deltaproteobacteria bacterium]
MPDVEPHAELTDGDPRSDDRTLRTAKPSAETLRDRLLATFEMFELGVEMMAANLRRRHPDASPEEIERLLDAWLLERPGAEEGDGPGVPVPLERFR